MLRGTNGIMGLRGSIRERRSSVRTYPIMASRYLLEAHQPSFCIHLVCMPKTLSKRIGSSNETKRQVANLVKDSATYFNADGKSVQSISYIGFRPVLCGYRSMRMSMGCIRITQ